MTTPHVTIYAGPGERDTEPCRIDWLQAYHVGAVILGMLMLALEVGK